VLVALGVGALLALSARPALPAYVDEITVDNPTQWIAHISVAGTDDDGRLGLGTASPESQRRFHLVIDQGEVWVFTFAHAGVRVEVPIGRDQLESDGWTVAVPPELGRRLAESQVPRSAPGTG
jgi:hypothetical protein